MSDNVTHLEFIYNRMAEVHGENKNYDYMLRFASIIEEMRDKKLSEDIKVLNNTFSIDDSNKPWNLRKS
jgi:hypothetical protein